MFARSSSTRVSPSCLLDPLWCRWGLRSPRRKSPASVKISVESTATSAVTDGRQRGRAVRRRSPVRVSSTSLRRDRLITPFADNLLRPGSTGRKTGPVPLSPDRRRGRQLAPTMPFPNHKRMLGAFDASVRRVRFRGLASRDLAAARVLNKTPLADRGTRRATDHVGRHDRAALNGWASGYSTPEELAAFPRGLATLKIGEAWCGRAVARRVRSGLLSIRGGRSFVVESEGGSSAVGPGARDVDLTLEGPSMADTIRGGPSGKTRSVFRGRARERDRISVLKDSRTRLANVEKIARGRYRARQRTIESLTISNGRSPGRVAL